ncbi:hypothetical protein PAHAL_3G051200 [Panicum hallii]|uniref:Uncharacterized protein n=1 Tax=Panicum hallii TaxID=206008 RepID=A0A2T8KH56_9POAL|nr:hypothetical protein PAHAL_3G051200 [Panicum hallii]
MEILIVVPPKTVLTSVQHVSGFAIYVSSLLSLKKNRRCIPFDFKKVVYIYTRDRSE